MHAGYAEVPVSGPGFSGARWTAATVSSTRAALGALQSSRSAVLSVAENVYLPIVAALVVSERGRVSILDIGGALGIAYHHVRAVLTPETVAYHVVETPATIAAAAAHPEWTRGIEFHAELPDLRADVIYLGSVIQYIEDYAGFLRTIAAYAADYILFVNSPIAEVPTSAAAQVNVKGSVIAYWFLNEREVVALMRSCGYEHVFTTPCDRSYDQTNLPPTHRFDAPSNLLFRRKDRVR